MKKWFSSLSQCYRTAVLSAIVTIAITVCISFLFFIGWMEIPLGILLGSGVGILSYILMGIFTSKEKEGSKPTSTVVFIIIRFILILASLVLCALLYYLANVHIFNVFAVAGGYFIPVICLIIVTVKGKE